MERGDNINKKRSLAMIGILTIMILIMSTIPVTATNEKEGSSSAVFKYGMFVLTCTNTEGLQEEEHVGGLSDVDFTASSNEFIILTFPIWGTTILDDNVEIHIQMEHFFGVIQTNHDGEVEVLGICKNISWELI